MFGPAGIAYVYASYGMHRCLNVVTGAEGQGEAVLIHALGPTIGIALMSRRYTSLVCNFCSGPGKLVQALGVTLLGDDLPLTSLQLCIREARSNEGTKIILSGPRIGITKGTEQPWRFGLAASPYPSRPFKPLEVR